MKKILAILLALTMLVVLCACGTTPAETTGSSSTTESSATAGSSATTASSETTSSTTEATTSTTATTTVPVIVTPEFDESKIVLSFGAISDVHVNAATGDAVDKVRSAVTLLAKEASKNGGKLDAIAVVGDIADNGQAAQLGYFRDAYESVAPEGIKTLLVTGNHDSIMGECLKLTDYQRILGSKYFGEGIDTEDTDLSIGVRDCVVNGYHFLMLEPLTYNSSIGCPYDEKAVQWLDRMLEKLTKAEPEKYVFVCTHPMIYNTCYGSTLDGSPSYWSTTALTSTLEKYSQVVTFGGHLHFPVNDNRSIMQGKFTSLGCGSVRYMAIERGGYENMAGQTTMNDRYEISSGLLIQVDENGNTRVTKMFFSEETSFEDQWILDHPNAEGTHLTRYSRETRMAANKAPALGNVELVQKESTKTGVKTYLDFDAAFDDDFTHHYKIELKNIDAGRTTVKNILSDFYHHAKRSDMKKNYSLFLGNLKDGKYRVTITAYDSWDAESESVVIEWESKKGEVSSDLPDAYVDLDFENGNITDSKNHVSITNKGAAVSKSEVRFDGKDYVANVLRASKGKYLICQFTELSTRESFSEWAQSGFSVEAFYVMNTKGTIQGIVCGTQNGGWGLAENASGIPYFITGGGTKYYNSAAYAKNAASTASLVHVVGVYDLGEGKCNIYINGALSTTVSINTNFITGEGDTFNRFCIGDDIKPGNVGGDFPTSGMTMVDAKIYSAALNSEQVAKAFEAAKGLLK